MKESSTVLSLLVTIIFGEELLLEHKTCGHYVQLILPME